MRNDDRLLQRLRNNEPAAWRQLEGQHGGWLHSAAQRLTGNAADADDLVQETLLAVARQIRSGKIEHLGCIASWLRRLLQYRFSDVIVRQQRGGRRRVKVVYRDQLPEQPQDDNEPSLLCEGQEAGRQIMAAVQQLDQPLQDVVQQKYFAPTESSNEQLSQSIGVSVSTVRGRLRRAYRQLRMKMERPSTGNGNAKVSSRQAGSYNRAQ